MYIVHEQFTPKNIKYGFFPKQITISKELKNEELELLKRSFDAEMVNIVTQKHTNKVVVIDECPNNCIADGQITSKKNLALAVLTADCVPILLADEEAKLVATIHAGWRGAKANIMKEAVEQMQNLGAKSITAILGPCIRQKDYEVDSNFYYEFLNDDQENKKFFMLGARDNHYLFNLPEYVKQKLSELKIKQILDIERNTYDDEENFFSFRRTTHNPESPMGSIVSVIMLLP